MSDLVIFFSGLLSLVNPAGQSTWPQDKASVLLLRHDFPHDENGSPQTLGLDPHYPTLSFSSTLPHKTTTSPDIGFDPVACASDRCSLTISDAEITIDGLKGSAGLPQFDTATLDSYLPHITKVCDKTTAAYFDAKALTNPLPYMAVRSRVNLTAKSGTFSVDPTDRAMDQSTEILVSFKPPGNGGSTSECGAKPNPRPIAERFRLTAPVTANRVTIKVDRTGTSAPSVSVELDLSSAVSPDIEISNSAAPNASLKDCSGYAPAAAAKVVPVPHFAAFYDLFTNAPACKGRLIAWGKPLPVPPQAPTVQHRSHAARARMSLPAADPGYGNGSGVHCPPDQLP